MCVVCVIKEEESALSVTSLILEKIVQHMKNQVCRY